MSLTFRVPVSSVVLIFCTYFSTFRGEGGEYQFSIRGRGGEFQFGI
jgi:hypothetical protein